MPRTEGSKNKATILKTDSEDRFLADALERYTYWKAEAAKAKEEGKTGHREMEYAQAFRLLFNKFSQIDREE